MKTTTENPDALAAAAAWAAHGLPPKRNSTHPICNGMQLTASEGRLQVSAFDYDVSAEAACPATTGEPGTVIVPGQKLLDVIARLPVGRQVQISDEDGRCLITCGAARFGLPMLPGDEYPTLPKLADRSGMIKGGDLHRLVAATHYAIDRDRSDPAESLWCVHLQPSGKTLIATTTDRYRIAVEQVGWFPADEDAPPANALMLYADRLASFAKSIPASSDVALCIGTDSTGAPNLAGFAFDGHTVTTRLLQVECAALIPLQKIDENSDGKWAVTTTAVVNFEELADALDRAMVANAKQVSLTFSPGEIAITGDGGEEADAVDVIGATYDGPGGVVCHVNPQFLLDAARAVGDERVKIEVFGKKWAFRVTAHRDKPITGRHFVQGIRV